MAVILYSTGCPKCKIIKAKLESKNVKFDIVDDVDVMKSKGFTTVPQVEINGKVVDFVGVNKLINEYNESESFEKFASKQLGA